MTQPTKPPQQQKPMPGKGANIDRDDDKKRDDGVADDDRVTQRQPSQADKYGQKPDERPEQGGERRTPIEPKR